MLDQNRRRIYDLTGSDNGNAMAGGGDGYHEEEEETTVVYPPMSTVMQKAGPEMEEMCREMGRIVAQAAGGHQQYQGG